MKKFLFIQDHLRGGGAEQICIDTAVGLSNKGYQVSVIILDSHEIRVHLPTSLNVFKLNIESEFLSGSIKRNKLQYLSVSSQKQILDIINTVLPDTTIVGHSHSFWLSPLLNGNVWYWAHGDILGLHIKPTYNPIKKLEYLKKFLQCKKACNILFNNKQLITVNQDIADLVYKHTNARKVQVIHNGINTIRLNYEHCTKKVWDTIFVGRLSEEKQVDIAIKAFAQSTLKGRMAVVGDGEYLTRLKKLVTQLNIEHRIDFLGWQQNPAHFINCSKSLLLTSRTEGCPLIVSESILIGVPVIAYNCSEGVSWQLASGELFRGLVPLNSFSQLIDTLSNVVHHPYPITQQDQDRLKLNRMIEHFEVL